MVVKAFCLCLIHFFKKSNLWYNDSEKLTEDKYYPLLQMKKLNCKEADYARQKSRSRAGPQS